MEAGFPRGRREVSQNAGGWEEASALQPDWTSESPGWCVNTDPRAPPLGVTAAGEASPEENAWTTGAHSVPCGGRFLPQQALSHFSSP